MRELLVPHAEQLIAKAVELALGGDTTALRICVDRLIPPAKAKDDPVRLPAIGGSLSESGRLILEALANERLTPDEAVSVLQGLATQARIIEVDDLERRIAVLEARNAKP
jgi:hypothetical protein